VKKIEAIIRVEKFEEVKEALKLLGYPGMTKVPVEGHSKQKGLKQQFCGTTFEVEFTPKIKLGIVVLDEDVSMTVDTIVRNARTGEGAVRVRTGEEGANTI